MKHNDARHLKVGVFVVVSLGLLFIALAMLGANAFLKETFMVETYIDESVQGLDVGAPVKYRGVKIGTVSYIRFVTSRYILPNEDAQSAFGKYILVEMEFDSKTLNNVVDTSSRNAFDQLVEAGLRVKLAPTGITGPMYLELDSLDPKLNPEPKISWQPMNAYIPSAPSTLYRMMEVTEQILRDIELADIETIAIQIKTLLTTADNVFTDASIAMENIGPTVIRLRKLVQRLDNLAASQQKDIEDLIHHLKVITQHLAELSEDAKDYPSQVIFGQPPPPILPGEDQ